MRKQMAYTFIILGVILLVSGVFMLTNKEKALATLFLNKPAQTTNQDPLTVPTSGPANKIPVKPAKPAYGAKNSGIQIDVDVDKLKGDAFEKFVVQNFDATYFKIKEWRGDKYVNGTYAESNLYPDLEIRFELGNRKNEFAVECKWRKGIYDDKLEWAKDYQFVNYRKFARRTNMPVFIIIGIGGTPNDPERLYIVPLEQVNSAVIHESELKQYQKVNNKKFYWNERENSLS